ncbi:MAG: hypothetical protein DRN96_04790 [Thermoproteota archaeon]|nr:MAG: hypothetical protein DRN96_04790 [Candidatus Korarchaeota archaeon]RLG53993.1 MAG: hypothetical protein DRN99_05860 [Candidatus Korarchaeota archaeon]
MQVEEAIREYNSARSPEAEAKLISARGGRIEVEFKLARACSLLDWVEDLALILEDKLKAKVKLEEIREQEGEEIKVIGVFKLEADRSAGDSS